MSCPICSLDHGFHDDEVHAAKVTIPRDKLIIKPAEQGGCRNCGASFGAPGANGCRHPRHES